MKILLAFIACLSLVIVALVSGIEAARFFMMGVVLGVVVMGFISILISIESKEA